MEQFTHELYGNREGYVALGHIDGDPRIEKEMPIEWYQLPRQRHMYHNRINELTDRGLNVYTSLTLHSAKKKSLDTALPSPWLWADDVTPDSIRFSMLLETSKDNYQVFVKLDTALDTAERSALMRGMRAQVSGDDCSSDAVHFVRIPGTLNTKRHGRFSVRLAGIESHTLSVSQARQQWPSNPERAGYILPIDRAAVELANGNLARIIERVNNRARKELANGRASVGLQVLEDAKAGNIDDWSLARWKVIYWLCNIGFPDDEVTALIWHWSDNGPLQWSNTHKSIDWRLQDIQRCIYGTANKPGVIGIIEQKIGRALVRTATTGGTQQPAKPLEKPRARADRPQRMTADEYLIWLMDDPSRQLAQRSAIAQELGVSTKTIQRWEAKLGDKIERARGRRQSFIRVKSRVDIIPQKEEQRESRVDIMSTESTLETSVSSDCSAENENSRSIDTHPPVLSGLVPSVAEHVQSEQSGSAAAGGPGGVSITTAPIEQPALPQLAAEYLDSRTLAERVSRKTGAITNVHTAKHFADLVAEYYGDRYSSIEARAAYKAEQDRRQEIINAEWRRFFARLDAMDPDELIAYVTGRCRSEVAELARDDLKFDARLYRKRLECAMRQVKRLGLQLPEPKTKAVKVSRASGAKAPARPKPEQPALFDATGLVARLHERIA